MPQRMQQATHTDIHHDVRTQVRQLWQAIGHLLPGTGPSSNLTWEYDEFTGDGASTNFTLTFQPYGVNNVAVNGVVKRQRTDYTFSTRFGVVVFTTPPAAAAVISVSYVSAGAGPLGSVVDNFNRADSTTTLGVTSDGQFAWTTAGVGGGGVPVWGISSSQAYYTGTTRSTIAYIDTGLGDGTLQATLATLNASAAGGLVFRFVDTTHYWVVYAVAGASSSRLYKVTTGNVFNAVGSAFTVTNGQVVQVVASGSSITVRVAGSVVVTATDSYQAGATIWGLYSEGTPPRLDDFSWTPL